MIGKRQKQVRVERHRGSIARAHDCQWCAGLRRTQEMGTCCVKPDARNGHFLVARAPGARSHSDQDPINTPRRRHDLRDWVCEVVAMEGSSKFASPLRVLHIAPPRGASGRSAGWLSHPTGLTPKSCLRVARLKAGQFAFGQGERSARPGPPRRRRPSRESGFTDARQAAVEVQRISIKAAPAAICQCSGPMHGRRPGRRVGRSSHVRALPA